MVFFSTAKDKEQWQGWWQETRRQCSNKSVRFLKSPCITSSKRQTQKCHKETYSIIHMSLPGPASLPHHHGHVYSHWPFSEHSGVQTTRQRPLLSISRLASESFRNLWAVKLSPLMTNAYINKKVLYCVEETALTHWEIDRERGTDRETERQREREGVLVFKTKCDYFSLSCHIQSHTESHMGSDNSAHSFTQSQSLVAQACLRFISQNLLLLFGQHHVYHFTLSHCIHIM